MNDSNESVEELAREIAAYLGDHPEAADSVDGIAHWWLQRQRYRTAVARVRDALSYLEYRGVVERTANAAGGEVYRATARRAGQDGRGFRERG